MDTQKEKPKTPTPEEDSQKNSEGGNALPAGSENTISMEDSPKNSMEIDAEDEDRLLNSANESSEADMPQPEVAPSDKVITELIGKLKALQIRLTGATRKKLSKLKVSSGEEKTQLTEAILKILRNQIEAHSKPTENEVAGKEGGSQAARDKRPRTSETTPSPSTRTQPKKQRTGEAAGSKLSYKTAFEGMKMAVIPSDYPTGKITEEKMLEIQEALDAKMVAEKASVQFIYSKLENDALIFMCANRPTANWLTEAIKVVKPWEGANLVSGEAKDLLKRTKILFYVPEKQKNENTETILSRIDNQNASLDAKKNWKLISRGKEAKSQTCVFSIPDETAGLLRNRKMKIFLGFAQLEIRELGKPHEGDPGKLKA